MANKTPSSFDKIDPALTIRFADDYVIAAFVVYKRRPDQWAFNGHGGHESLAEAYAWADETKKWYNNQGWKVKIRLILNSNLIDIIQ